MKQRGYFRSASAPRQGTIEQVIALIGIEVAELVAQDCFEVAGERRASESVIDYVHFAAEVRIPHEPHVVCGEVIG